ncbi:MAG: NADPH-dependent glutamate synthase [Candidatus Bipolaricaulota bacterium]
MIQETQVPMREQDAGSRIHNFDEVPLGYTEEEAREEAARCLKCKRKPCVKGCPVEVDIPTFIEQVEKGDFRAAAATIKRTNNLPAVCGRVCPQESQCQGVCTLGKKFEPSGIGRLERFVADWEREHGVESVEPPSSTGRRVAVIGSGPAGLTCAADLRLLGHEVTVFESLHEPGGVLMYGIPEFRLPKEVVGHEVEGLRRLGVKIETNVVVGNTVTVDGLLAEGHEAVFVGSGAGLPRFLGIPGETLIGVYSANEFLTRVNLMRAWQFPEYDTPVGIGRRVAVIGGGNVAMDAARTALRLGAEKVTVLYRRTRDEMPARVEEAHHAEEEGVEMQFLVNPVQLSGEAGTLTQAECLRMELGPPDESGRRRPIPIEGSEFLIDVDTCIVAVGNQPHPLVPRTTPGLQVGRRGTVEADEEGATSRREVFAGGDIVTGAATVISAMGAGKQAAAAIHRYLGATG